MPAGIVAGQLGHLAHVAQLPHVTLQVVPECWHAGLPAGFILTDSAAYTESLIAGQVYADEETVSAFGVRFDSIRRGPPQRISLFQSGRLAAAGRRPAC